MNFKVLTLEDCLKVKEWRNETLNALRTPYLLTEEQQKDFYNNVVCDRKASARYWGIIDTITVKPSAHTEPIYDVTGRPYRVVYNEGGTFDKFIGMAGIENIEWENRRGEISMIIDPSQRSKGNGDDAFARLLDKGFNELNLENIWGVCYECNPATEFWMRQINKYNGKHVLFPNMKFCDGKYWRGLYFNFDRGEIWDK